MSPTDDRRERAIEAATQACTGVGRIIEAMLAAVDETCACASTAADPSQTHRNRPRGDVGADEATSGDRDPARPREAGNDV